MGIFNFIPESFTRRASCGCAGYIEDERAVVMSPLDYGARADGKSLDTKAIQTALDKAAARGGTVILGSGVWLSGPLSIPSKVTLRLEKGAILRADNRENDFVPAYIGEASKDKEAFIQARGGEGFTIEGNGVIDGNGAALWWEEAKAVREELKAGRSDLFEQRFPGVVTANGMPRPWLLEIADAKNITIKGVTLTNSPMWTLVIRNSQNVVIDGVKVEAPVDSPNTDGIDIVSCKDVVIRNCSVFTGDDNIAIKSGITQDGAAPSENILIEECVIQAGHGLSIGSETANGIGSVKVHNVRFVDTENGIRIKSARDRGNKIGPLEVENVVMEQVQTPLLVTCSYAGQSGVNGLNIKGELETQAQSPTTPYIKGLKATKAQYAAVLSGLPEAPIEEIALDDIEIEAKHGIQVRYAQGAIANFNIKVEEGNAIERGPGEMFKEAR